MMIGAARSIVGAVAIAVTSPAVVCAAQTGATSVADQGTTRIAAPPSAAPPAVATIVTRLATRAEATADRATRCSGGRTACSLVDRLTLEVGGHAVEVPPRAVLLLADVDDARLERLGGGRYELFLTCGDAAPAYQVRLFFTGVRVDRLDIFSDEAGMIEQTTVFHDVSKAFR